VKYSGFQRVATNPGWEREAASKTYRSIRAEDPPGRSNHRVLEKESEEYGDRERRQLSTTSRRVDITMNGGDQKDCGTKRRDVRLGGDLKRVGER